MNAILFRDLLLNMLLGLTALVVLVLPQINEPTHKLDESKPAGVVAVSAAWVEGNIDCDLWVKSPDDVVAVGYSRKTGKTWSLLRDDLGIENDTSPINLENAFARATPAGEWIVNLHGYSLPTGPVTVHVEIAINGRLLLSRDIEIKPKQERTVIRFTLDDNGQVISSNEVLRPLRSAGK